MSPFTDYLLFRLTLSLLYSMSHTRHSEKHTCIAMPTLMLLASVLKPSNFPFVECAHNLWSLHNWHWKCTSWQQGADLPPDLYLILSRLNQSRRPELLGDHVEWIYLFVCFAASWEIPENDEHVFTYCLSSMKYFGLRILIFVMLCIHCSFFSYEYVPIMNFISITPDDYLVTQDIWFQIVYA